MPEVFKREIVAVGPDNLDYHVQEYQDQIIIDGLTGRNTVDGLVRYQLKYGGAVNKIADDEFEVVATGVRLKVNP